MRVRTRGIEPFPHFRRQRRGIAPHGLKTLLLAHPISIDGWLVFKIEGNRSEDLSEGQGIEFSENRFGRKPFIKTMDDGIERHTSSGNIVPAVALFDVFLRHQCQL